MASKNQKSTRNLKKQPSFTVRFANFSPEEAQGTKNPLCARSRAARLYGEHLKLNPTQTQSIDTIHALNLSC
jgi:hypothetical protein